MAMAKPSSAKEQDNLVCQDVIQNGLDSAVDVTQTLRAGAPSAQDLTSRPASGRLTAFLKLDVKQLKEAVAGPEIFNTDQGSQFTGQTFTGALAGNGIAISMDGKGAWRDNVFVERLWRSVKYEEVYLRAYDSVSEARASIGRYFDFYNGRRPTRALTATHPINLLQPAAHPRGGLTPAETPLRDAENLFREPGPLHSTACSQNLNI
jgi:transposase InsO family protein